MSPEPSPTPTHATAHAEAPVGDLLLEELGRERGGTMRDIVQTIQASQYDLMVESPDVHLLVQGGPGTGKTALALVRISWLLFNEARLREGSVAYVGPNLDFLRYVSAVLPKLGNAEVRHVTVRGLYEKISDEGKLLEDDPRLRVIKGSPVMEQALESALRARISIPAGDASVAFGQGTLKFTPEDLEKRVNALIGGPWNAGRKRFRQQLTEAARIHFRQDPSRTHEAIDKQVRAIAKAVWPGASPSTILRSLWKSPDILRDALQGSIQGADLDEAVELLTHQKAAGTCASDVGLLDYLDYRIDGYPARYTYMVVDEVQDLTPMELKMVARRSEGGRLTAFGDVAQASEPGSLRSWDEIESILDLPSAPLRVELLYGYRVPAPALERANGLLAQMGVGLKPVTPVRGGEAIKEAAYEVRNGEADPESLSLILEAAITATGNDRAVAIVVPARRLEAVREVLVDAGTDFHEPGDGTLITDGLLLALPQAVKGLEFDHVIVVDPEGIKLESGGDLRRLYIAYTRCTQTLTVLNEFTAESSN